MLFYDMPEELRNAINKSYKDYMDIPRNLKEAIEKTYKDFRNLEDYNSLPYFFKNNSINDNETYRIIIEGEKDNSSIICRLTKKQLEKALNERINQLQEIYNVDKEITKLYINCKNEEEEKEVYEKLKKLSDKK